MCEGRSLELGNAFRGAVVRQDHFEQPATWLASVNAADEIPYPDLVWPLRRRKYDKRAGRIMIRDFRIHYFGEHKRLTKKRREEFFSNDRNFICL